METEQTADERLLEILNGCEIKIDREKYPEWVFFLKEGEIYFELEKTFLWVSDIYVWDILKSEFNMKNTDIQNLIIDVLEENFNIKGVTPAGIYLLQVFSI